MRGKVVLLLLASLESRITPAYAGKSDPDSYTWDQGQDHPRVCGEKQEIYPHNQSNLGSPPRMRGKGAFFVLLLNVFRITPAYAGKSNR